MQNLFQLEDSSRNSYAIINAFEIFKLNLAYFTSLLCLIFVVSLLPVQFISIKFVAGSLLIIPASNFNLIPSRLMILPPSGGMKLLGKRRGRGWLPLPIFGIESMTKLVIVVHLGFGQEAP